MFWDVLSTFVNVVGNISQGNAQARAANYNQQIATYNAGRTREAGKIEEDRIRREARKKIGLIRANVGASGFALEGSALDVLAESAYNAEFDALATRYNYETSATSQDMQSRLYASEARDARRASYIGAASSLLKGATPYLEGRQPFKLGGGS